MGTGDEMYKDIDDEHVKKIKFYSFTKDDPEDAFRQFHFLSGTFFEGLRQKPSTDDEVLALSWNQTENMDNEQPLEMASEE